MTEASIITAIMVGLIGIGIALTHWVLRKRTGHGFHWAMWLLLVAMVAGVVYYADYRVESRREQLVRQISGLAPTLARETERLGHEHLGYLPEQDDPIYLEIIEAQKRWVDINPDVIADVYTFYIDDNNEAALIVDSETDYDHNGLYEGDREARTDPGETWGEAEESEHDAMNGMVAVFDEPYEDRWGYWVSAYEPLRNQDGEIYAVLGIDFPANLWVSQLRESRIEALVTGCLPIFMLVVAVVLVQLVNHTNESLRRARDDAETANYTKSAFLANMSHEIRTPLTAILGYAEILNDEESCEILNDDRANDPRNAEIVRRCQALNTIQVAGQHLLTVINDILDLSKIEAGKMSIEQVETPLAAILRDVENLMRPRAAGKGVHLATEIQSPIPDRILSDPTRLRQILMNLLGNAIKFTEDGKITICVSVESLDDQSTNTKKSNAGTHDKPARLIVDITDTGVGMSEDQADNLFKPFSQADATVTRKHGGTGLGLAISRRFAALMGGDVLLARTQLNEGSCFRIVLPCSPMQGANMVTKLQPHERPTPQASATQSQNDDASSAASSERVLQGHILLAEDGMDNQRLISFHLKRAGATVDLADNGLIALDMIEQAIADGHPYDMLVTDMQMPEMDGYTLATTLRQRGSTMPIIALTAHSMADDRQKCLDAGCDDYASKPINKRALLTTCATWINQPSQRAAS